MEKISQTHHVSNENHMYGNAEVTFARLQDRKLDPSLFLLFDSDPCRCKDNTRLSSKRSKLHIKTDPRQVGEPEHLFQISRGHLRLKPRYDRLCVWLLVVRATSSATLSSACLENDVSTGYRRVFAIASIPGGRHRHKSHENIARHLYIAMGSKLVYTHSESYMRALTRRKTRAARCQCRKFALVECRSRNQVLLRDYFNST